MEKFERLNKRRGDLIALQDQRKLTFWETRELARLQKACGDMLFRMYPLPWKYLCQALREAKAVQRRERIMRISRYAGGFALGFIAGSATVFLLSHQD